jgi:plastocyanin
MRGSIARAVILVLVFFSTGKLSYAGDIEGSVSAIKKKHLPNTVVFLDSVKGEFTPPEAHVVMDQKNLVFHPHVLPILAGTTVDFLNSDDVAHNVFSPDEAADKFNLGTWPTGKIKSYKFEKRCDKVCDAVMLCNVHPEMEAYVVVMLNPYYAKADEEGKFKIKNVPAGKYTLQVWHPNLKAGAQTVNVPADSSVTVVITLIK